MSAATYSDLELILAKRDATTYTVGFRFNAAGDEAEQRSERIFTLDAAAALRWGPGVWADNLGAAFFNADVKGEFNRYRSLALAKSEDAALKVRISIDSTAPELHGIRWEILRDPAVADPTLDTPLFTGEKTVVSRFLASSYDSQPIRLRAQADLSALVVIANPEGLGTWELEPVIVEDQLDAAKQAMAQKNGGARIIVDTLAPGGEVKLADIITKLMAGQGYDILYLVCHGILLPDDGPVLLLEDGTKTKGSDFITRIRELNNRPRLIVLASCQSAGKTAVGLSGVGPKLADAGIPAVIAMQGNITMETARQFMGTFFEQLMTDGQIDRAVSLARGAVRDRQDYWKPVLFMRLRNGRIWYNPGFAGEDQDVAWNAICDHIQEDHFVPILGPELGEEDFGGSAELATRMADEENVRLTPHDRTDLARVAQFIATDQDYPHAVAAVTQGLLRQAADRMAAAAGHQSSIAQVSGDDLWGDVMQRLAAEPDNPHRILASLRAPVYLNASYGPLLCMAIDAERNNQGPPPYEVVLTQWRNSPNKVAGPPQPVNLKPTADAPWDYHPFGMIDDPESLVLTEDDFFDYLIAAKCLNLLHKGLTGRIAQSSLLFLGFRLDDWRFRVLFRLILSTEGGSQLSNFAHVGVQINPDDTNIGDLKQARRHLEKYFREANPATCRLSVYWGSSSDFLRELKKRLATYRQNQKPRPVIKAGGWRTAAQRATA